MIGWTKTCKRCKVHGIVLRKRKYSEKADYCPACGEQLTLVSVPYLFQIYFHPALMIVPGLLAFLFGLLFFVDARGCSVEQNKRSAILAEQQAIEDLEIREQYKQSLLTMPSQWKILYAGIDAIYYKTSKWKALRAYFEESPEIQLPKLEPEQLSSFLRIFSVSDQDEAFALITGHMQLEPGRTTNGE